MRCNNRAQFGIGSLSQTHFHIQKTQREMEEMEEAEAAVEEDYKVEWRVEEAEAGECREEAEAEAGECREEAEGEGDHTGKLL
jgi:hypothetical protein